MSDFKFNDPIIESVKFIDDRRLEIKMRVFRGENNTKYHLTMTTYAGSINCLLRQYVEACNERLSAAQIQHEGRQEQIAQRWREFAKTGRQP